MDAKDPCVFSVFGDFRRHTFQHLARRRADQKQVSQRSDSAQNHIQIEPPIFIGFRRQLGAIHDHAFTKREALTPSKSELWKKVATPLLCFYMNSWNFLEITLRPLMTGCILNKNKLHLPPKKWFLMFSSHGSFRKKRFLHQGTSAATLLVFSANSWSSLAPPLVVRSASSWMWNAHPTHTWKTLWVVPSGNVTTMIKYHFQ